MKLEGVTYCGDNLMGGQLFTDATYLLFQFVSSCQVGRYMAKEN